MRAKFVITSRDGKERAEMREAKFTEDGLKIDGPGLPLVDGDRVVWATEVRGLCGAFHVSVTVPVH